MQRQMLGEVISTLRRKRGITQAELAELVGVSNKAVSKWETDEANPEMSLIPKLASALGVGIGELFGENANGTAVDPIKAEMQTQAEAATTSPVVNQPIATKPLNKKALAYGITAIVAGVIMLVGLILVAYFASELAEVLGGAYDHRGDAYVRHEIIGYSIALAFSAAAAIAGLIVGIIFLRKWKKTR